METRDELSMANKSLGQMPDALSLHHCLKIKQLKLNVCSGKDLAKGEFNIMHT